MKVAAGLVAMVLLAACGTITGTIKSSRVPSSSASLHTSPSVSTRPAAEPAVAVVDWNQDGAHYTLSLVAATGKVLASVHAVWPSGGQCGPVQAAIISPPAVSTSDSRAYYLDAGGIKWLMEDGSTGTAFAALKPRANIAVGLAVAPDDSVFALNIIDYAATPSTEDLTVTRLGASALGRSIYSARSPDRSSAVWPIGWHDGNLVLGYHPFTCTEGGSPGVGDAFSYHIVDPTTAARKATIGSDSGDQCERVGFPTHAGIPCGQYLGGSTQVLSWTGSPGAVFGASFPGALSPSGTAYVGTVQAGDSSSMTLIRAEGNASTLPGDIGKVMWIDDDHFLVGPTVSQPQPRVYEAKTLKSMLVSARGEPVARIPGSFGE